MGKKRLRDVAPGLTPKDVADVRIGNGKLATDLCGSHTGGSQLADVPHIVTGQLCEVLAFPASATTVIHRVVHVLKMRRPFQILWSVVQAVKVLMVDLVSNGWPGADEGSSDEHVDCPADSFPLVRQGDSEITPSVRLRFQNQANTSTGCSFASADTPPVANLVHFLKVHDRTPMLIVHSASVPEEE